MRERYAYPVEIHSHTQHSDGSFTVEELVQAAIEFGYKGLILTDHNSSAGFKELTLQPPVVNGELVVLRGMEWTTYFGHMLAHDASYDVDWREATIDTIDHYMQEVQDAGGLVGIAHPYQLGSPFCTGCHWEYQVQDYRRVNYIEIWNRTQPQDQLASRQAYDFWVDKLNRGYEIAASSGRDWHRPDAATDNVGVTYLLSESSGLTQASFKEALRVGAFYITLGPRIDFTLSAKEIVRDNLVMPAREVAQAELGDSYTSGDRVRGLVQATVNMTIYPTELEALVPFELTDMVITIYNNTTILNVVSLHYNQDYSYEIMLQPGYLRYEVRATYRGKVNTLVLVGNPVYLYA